MNFPWYDGPLRDWSIVGMNHYSVGGMRFLFVAMVKGEHCIKEEGKDDQYLWNRLSHKAWKINDPSSSDSE